MFRFVNRRTVLAYFCPGCATRTEDTSGTSLREDCIPATLTVVTLSCKMLFAIFLGIYIFVKCFWCLPNRFTVVVNPVNTTGYILRAGTIFCTYLLLGEREYINKNYDWANSPMENTRQFVSIDKVAPKSLQDFLNDSTHQRQQLSV